MLSINEIFGLTIQGEGKRVGKPSVFIRFSKCNFTCSGFSVKYTNEEGIEKLGCDTFYAVDKTFNNQWRELSGQNIINEVMNLCGMQKPDIVITGGEPLLNWKSEEFQKILKYFHQNSFNITIETNASINIDLKEEYQKNILFSMSVKLANSGEKYSKRIKIPAIKNIIENSYDSYLKFVIEKKNADESLNEIKELIKELPKCEVYLMPMGENVQELAHNEECVINLCINNSFIYSDRLHIRLWNDKRGV